MHTELISLKDVECRYEANNITSSLKGINLNIHKETCFGIVGAPNSGKNALLRCLYLADKPTSGMISINNKNIYNMNNTQLKKLQTKMSFVNHESGLLNSKTVAENVALPLIIARINKEKIYAKVDSVLNEIGLSDKYNANLNQLSTLAKQKISLARALVTNPKILLLNDITKNLSIQEIDHLINLIKQIKHRHNLTIIVTTYDIEVIKSLCDQVAIIEQNKIIEISTPNKIFLNPKSKTVQELIKKNSFAELPNTIKKSLRYIYTKNNNYITRIAFTGCLSAETILAKLLKENNIKLTIIQAYQEKIQKDTINILIAELELDKQNLDIVFNYLTENGLYMEVIGYVTGNN